MKSSANWLKSQRAKPRQTKIDYCSKPVFWFRLHSIWQLLRKYLIASSELQVWSTCDRQGNIWWSAYDPKTKRSIYHVSEEQILAWIERRDR